MRECVEDEAALHVGHRGAGSSRRSGIGLPHQVAGSELKMPWFEHGFRGEHDRALDGVLQFANVSRPWIREEQLARCFAEPLHVASVLAVEALEEVLHKCGDVLAAFTQGGQRDGDHVEPEEQVFAKGALLYRLLEVAV